MRTFFLSLAALMVMPSLASAQACLSRIETARSELEREFFASERPWRGFARSRELTGCDRQAADVIAAFRNDHASRITDDASAAFASQNRFKLYMVEARYAARDGQYERAISLFERARDEPQEARGSTFLSYIDLQIAFLRRDRNALNAARGQLSADVAALPETDDRLIQLAGLVLLNQADEFVRCFDRTYLEADSSFCTRRAR